MHDKYPHYVRFLVAFGGGILLWAVIVWFGLLIYWLLWTA